MMFKHRAYYNIVTECVFITKFYIYISLKQICFCFSLTAEKLPWRKTHGDNYTLVRQ